MRLTLTIVFAFLIASALGLQTIPPVTTNATALAWEDCDDFDCAVVKVPMDYTKPNGRQLDIALRRHEATDPARRIGSLLINPGGPGASGWAYLESFVEDAPEEILARFDLIGFDPRGVGKSTALVCHQNLQAYFASDPTPESPADWQRVEKVFSDFGANCARADRELMPHLGTANVARDIDQIRVALGEEKITYIGFSYGTSLGLTYADMFPTRLRAAMLDGGWDPSLSMEQYSFEQAQGFEFALQSYAEECRRNACALTAWGDPMALIDGILAQVEVSPMPSSGGGRGMTSGEFLFAISNAGYGPEYWEDLTAALALAAGANDSTLLLQSVDEFFSTEADGSESNIFEIYNVVSCLDMAVVNDPEYYKRLATKFHVVAPHFGSQFAQYGLLCNLFGIKSNPVPMPTVKSLAPIVVVGTVGNPATPYKWSQTLAGHLPSSVLLTYKAEGHGSYLLGNDCIDDYIDRYLLDLVLPPPGAACGDSTRQPFPVQSLP